MNDEQTRVHVPGHYSRDRTWFLLLYKIGLLLPTWYPKNPSSPANSPADLGDPFTDSSMTNWQIHYEQVRQHRVSECRWARGAY